MRMTMAAITFNAFVTQLQASASSFRTTSGFVKRANERCLLIAPRPLKDGSAPNAGGRNEPESRHPAMAKE